MPARGLGTKYQGSKWIRPEKRLAIYLRDGLACCYCGEVIEDGIGLSLDHLEAHSNGGNNHETNLVTSCRRCNSARGNRDYREFVTAVAQYLNHDVKSGDIVNHIEITRFRALDIPAARAVMNNRRS